MSVLSNGVELDLVTAGPKEPSPEGTIRFLWSGYLGEHKGILVFLQAIEQLWREKELWGVGS